MAFLQYGLIRILEKTLVLPLVYHYPEMHCFFVSEAVGFYKFPIDVIFFHTSYIQTLSPLDNGLRRGPIAVILKYLLGEDLLSRKLDFALLIHI
jgi:hypothetical protein